MDGKRRLTPEERELEQKKVQLDKVKQDLVERELELETALGGLIAFEKKYQEATGQRYAMLDELHFRIAELRAAQQPEQPSAQAAAKVASVSRATAAGTRRPPRKPPPKREPSDKPPAQHKPTPAFNPSEEIKRLYRDVAKALHPDFANDDQERENRHAFMARANAAYEANDPQKLVEILHEWHVAPESVRGADAAADLIRAIRQIARCEDRLEQIQVHMGKIETHGMFGVKMLAEEADKLERDFLGEMTMRLDDEIEAGKALLLKMGGKVPDPSELQRADEDPEVDFTVSDDPETKAHP